MSGPTFGQDAPCRTCKTTGRLRGSGLSWRERDELTKHGQDVPKDRPCDDCGGTGFVPVPTADRDRRPGEPIL